MSHDKLVIKPDAWKKERDRLSRRIRRNLHVTEVNPGANSSRLRYDFILTAAEVTALVEEVMRCTERLAVRELERRRLNEPR